MADMFNTFPNCSKELSRLLPIPDHVQLVSVNEELRDGMKVEIRRYQVQESLYLGGPHLTIISAQEGAHPLSYTNLISQNSGNLPKLDEAERLAMAVMRAVDKEYAKGLTLLRIENQNRHFTDDTGDFIHFPVLWVKMMHSNGSYNWVTLGENGQVIEFERQVRWNYSTSRRQTEMWFHDAWVLARNGKGPQLLPPAALA
ncbi:hypothetical protein [Paenibacillus apiarius]|uniref:hypothetical protein n=1 Tax=Paenibacillus apiarius TaxID=46240 RepID=UPI00197E3324|nr:hypothetical protein [Paenibacillus apiarius]MBN3526920.1 hypothetical protein [Paenibacillus apiarius]